MHARTSFTIVVALLAAQASLAQIVIQPDVNRVVEFPDTRLGQIAELHFTATCDSGGPWYASLSRHEPHFGVPRGFWIRLGDTARFVLSFTPGEARQYEDTLSWSISWGDVRIRDQWTLRGTGFGEGTPAIVLDHDDLFFSMYPDEWFERWGGMDDELGIGNDGAADLHVEDISFDADWLVFEPRQLLVVPGRWAWVWLSLNDAVVWNHLEAGEYEATLTVTSDDPAHPRIEIPVHFSRPYMPHFFFGMEIFEAQFRHIISVQGATIAGENLQPRDEIGVFSRWDEWGRLTGRLVIQDGDQFEVFGAPEDAWGDLLQEGDSLVFRIYDFSADEEYPAIAQFLEGPDRFQDGGFSEIRLRADFGLTEQVIPLVAGWMLISLRVVPEQGYWVRDEGPDVVRLFQDLRNLLFVKDQSGRFYSPPRQFNNIPFLPLDQGLQIKLGRNDTLTVSGEAIPYDADIHLRQGWNIMAYYPDYELTFGQAFEEMAEAGLLEMVKDAHGRFYLPSRNFGYDYVIEVNSALQAKATRDCVYRYPGRPGRVFAERPMVEERPLRHFSQPEPSDGNMSVLITAFKGLQAPEAAELACLTSDGRVAGVVRLEGEGPWGMAVWGDDPLTEDVVEGIRAKETLQFRCWDPIGNRESSVSYEVVEGDGARYSTNGFVHLALTSVGRDPHLQPTELRLAEPHPNPFNSIARVEFALPAAGEVRLSLVDVSGRRMPALVDEWLPAGTHSATLDASKFPNGVYLLTMDTGGKRLIQRAVVLK